MCFAGKPSVLPFLNIGPGEVGCPVCQQPLREGEIESHCAMEMERLDQQPPTSAGICLENTTRPDLGIGRRGEPNTGARWEVRISEKTS